MLHSFVEQGHSFLKRFSFKRFSQLLMLQLTYPFRCLPKPGWFLSPRVKEHVLSEQTVLFTGFVDQGLTFREKRKTQSGVVESECVSKSQKLLLL